MFTLQIDLTTASNECESFYWKDGTLQEAKVDALVRPYAQAVAGVPTLHKYEKKKALFTLEYKATKALAPYPTEIFVGPLIQQGKDLKVTITPAGAATWGMGAGNKLLVTHSDAIADETLISVKISA